MGSLKKTVHPTVSWEAGGRGSFVFTLSPSIFPYVKCFEVSGWEKVSEEILVILSRAETTLESSTRSLSRLKN